MLREANVKCRVARCFINADKLQYSITVLSLAECDSGINKTKKAMSLRNEQKKIYLQLKFHYNILEFL
jgi:hypothetical protein